MAFEPQKINATIVGRAVAVAEDKFDGKLTELRIAVGHSRKNKDTDKWEDTGTTWLTYQASGQYAEPLKTVGKGDLVKITDCVIESREFDRRDGTKGTQVSARFGTLEVLEKPRNAQQAPTQAQPASNDVW